MSFVKVGIGIEFVIIKNLGKRKGEKVRIICGWDIWEILGQTYICDIYTNIAQFRRIFFLTLKIVIKHNYIYKNVMYK